MIRRLLAWLLGPRAPVVCGRCGNHGARACWRVDCPRHEVAS